MAYRKVFMVECEFEIGLENYIFETVSKARECIDNNEVLQEHNDTYSESVDDLFDDGLLRIVEKELVL